mmetsp:Transcript_4883/g.15126  ORF Transcript_4883/g.15126 Transcript_4883/m.15126 type:complete len:213 (+) Transcript_4883:3164-3802(+)
MEGRRDHRQGPPVTIGTSVRAPHSAQLPSYTAASSLPRRAAASASTHAVMPEPQLITSGRVRSTRASANAASSSSTLAKRVPSEPSARGRRSLVKGSDRAPGMCPLTQLARGSGALPSNRPAARASTTCDDAQPSATIVRICASVRSEPDGSDVARQAGAPARTAGGDAPATVASPSSFHAGRPPSSTLTPRWPNARNCHHARGAEKTPAPS